MLGLPECCVPELWATYSQYTHLTEEKVSRSWDFSVSMTESADSSASSFAYLRSASPETPDPCALESATPHDSSREPMGVGSSQMTRREGWGQIAVFTGAQHVKLLPGTPASERAGCTPWASASTPAPCQHIQEAEDDGPGA